MPFHKLVPPFTLSTAGLGVSPAVLSVIRCYKYGLIECISKCDRVLLLYHTALDALNKVYDSSKVHPEAILVN